MAFIVQNPLCSLAAGASCKRVDMPFFFVSKTRAPVLVLPLLRNLLLFSAPQSSSSFSAICPSLGLFKQVGRISCNTVSTIPADLGSVNPRSNKSILDTSAESPSSHPIVASQQPAGASDLDPSALPNDAFLDTYRTAYRTVFLIDDFISIVDEP